MFREAEVFTLSGLSVHFDRNTHLSTLRRIGLNIFKLDSANAGSIRRKRKKAGWNNTYLAQLLEKFILGPG